MVSKQHGQSVKWSRDAPLSICPHPHWERRLHAGSLSSQYGACTAPGSFPVPLAAAPPCRPPHCQGLRPSHWVDARSQWRLLHPRPPLVTVQGCTAQPKGNRSHTACADGVPKPVTCTTWSLQASRLCPDPRLASSCGALNRSDRRVTLQAAGLVTEEARNGDDAPYGAHPLSSG